MNRASLKHVVSVALGLTITVAATQTATAQYRRQMPKQPTTQPAPSQPESKRFVTKLNHVVETLGASGNRQVRAAE